MKQMSFPISQAWGMALRQHPDAPPSLRAPETALSYPLILGKTSVLKVGYVLYPTSLSNADTYTIDKPFAVIVVHVGEKISVRRYDESPEEFVGLHDPFPVNVPVNVETKNKKKDIYNAYIPLLDKVPNESSLDEGKELLSLFTAMVTPALLPYYQAIAPNFFKWLAGDIRKF